MDKLFDKEKEIMDIFWTANQPYLISDVLKAKPTLNRNTVAKALISLERKGYLKVDSIRRTITRTGRAYVPAITKEDYEKNEHLLDSIQASISLPQTSLAFFSNLIECGDIDDAFIVQLEDMIQKYKTKKEQT